MKHTFRRPAAALAAALVVSAVAFTPAYAAHRHGRYHHGNAAMLGAVAGVFGTIAALAAEDQYRDEYYGYDGGPYYAPYGYYYGGPRGYYGGYWHHHHHWR